MGVDSAYNIDFPCGLPYISLKATPGISNITTCMDKAFSIVSQLSSDFRANEEAYLSPSYQESQIRQDFIDKFFTALGWDVTHATQRNPYEQEVHIENKVVMQGSQRRADYAFCAGAKKAFNEVVCELYGLTKEEMKMVEGKQ